MLFTFERGFFSFFFIPFYFSISCLSKEGKSWKIQTNKQKKTWKQKKIYLLIMWTPWTGKDNIIIIHLLFFFWIFHSHTPTTWIQPSSSCRSFNKNKTSLMINWAWAYRSCSPVDVIYFNFDNRINHQWKKNVCRSIIFLFPHRNIWGRISLREVKGMNKAGNSEWLTGWRNWKPNRRIVVVWERKSFFENSTLR